MVKNSPASGDIRDMGSIPRFDPSVGKNPLGPFQYSCLENPMDRGVWKATVHGITKELDMTETT